MIRLYLIAPRSNALSQYLGLAAGEGGDSIIRVASAPLTTVAALAPADFAVTLCDEALQPIDFDTPADVVGITTNVCQASRALEIADEFRRGGKTVVMGGPHVSLAPEMFDGRADALVVGELEPVAGEFFADMRRRSLNARYQGGKADLALSPPPRWDLYPNDRAAIGVVQTSRGCPFECNFCDVIQYLGRVQRHKANAQVIGEIQTLYDLGYDFVFLADDNFTVYRKRARSLLTALAAWNGSEGRDYISFGTQMSIDVARDAELLALCNDAGLLNAFIGIETSDQAVLAASKKRQNLRIDLVEECKKVVRAGLSIEGGLMVGFDSDDHSAFQRQFDFAMALPVGNFNVSVLVAPVATPLYDAMRAAGRIVSGEMPAQVPSTVLVTNFMPAQMTRAELFVGAKWLINKLLHPDAFYTRLLTMSDLLAPPPWVRRGGRKLQHPSRKRVEALFSRVMRDLVKRDRRIAALVARCFSLMRARPEIRDGISAALSQYLMTVRSHELTGIYEPHWAQLPAPPFAAATSAAPQAGVPAVLHAAKGRTAESFAAPQ